MQCKFVRQRDDARLSSKFGTVWSTPLRELGLRVRKSPANDLENFDESSITQPRVRFCLTSAGLCTTVLVFKADDD